ncbi:MAG TPA: transposase [Planctomycetota bacterium]|nr:transposase [Planctomycetota bacterium]
MLAYLAAYTHRIAISNQRILAFDGETVTFSWRDYADGNEQKTMSLPAVEFLRRFAMHIVPPHFTRVRYYGFLANCVRGEKLERARQLLGSRRALREIVRYAPLCPRCRQGTMLRVARIDPQRPRTWFDSS